MKQGVKQNIKVNGSYFITMTIVNWLDVFTRECNRDTIIEALKFCIKNKGLNVYCYCLMTNHLHMIVNCNEPFQLKDTIRDFKKYTSKKIIYNIKNYPESRRSNFLTTFSSAASKSSKHKLYKVWKSGNHAIELYSEKFTWQKLNYIHQNPVKAKLVLNPQDWVYSSASNYHDLPSILDEVHCLNPRLQTY